MSLNAGGGHQRREERGWKVQRAGSEPHLLMAEAEGLFAPVPVQFKDANQVSNGSDDGQAKNRLDSGSRLQASASWKSLILKKSSKENWEPQCLSESACTHLMRDSGC